MYLYGSSHNGSKEALRYSRVVQLSTYLLHLLLISKLSKLSHPKNITKINCVSKICAGRMSYMDVEIFNEEQFIILVQEHFLFPFVVVS